MEINTELCLSDLTDETKDQLLEAIIDRLKDDKEEVEDIAIIVDTGINDDELTEEEAIRARLFRTQQQFEKRAEKILKDTFWGECNIGGEI